MSTSQGGAKPRFESRLRVIWEAVTALGTAFTALVIVASAIVGFGQLSQFRGQRRDTAAVELVRSLQDDSFVRAFGLVYSLPVGTPASEFRAKGVDYVDAGVTIGFRLEMLGVLVHRGAIPFDIVEDLAGGMIVGAWRRLADLTRETRREKEWPQYLEWFQWLAERFEERDRLNAAPAHLRLKDWRPPGSHN